MRKREGGGEEEEEREEEQAGCRRDTDGTQAGREEEEEKTGAERGWGSRVRVHDSCAYSSIVSLFCRLQIPYISHILGFVFLYRAGALTVSGFAYQL